MDFSPKVRIEPGLRMTYSGSCEPRARRKLASLNLIHLVAAILCSSTVNSAPHAQTALLGGAIATSDIYGARAAREIMNERGNVADAAVAVAFVEAVTYPEAGNIGGGGFLTLWFGGHPYFLDYRETAPAAAARDMYLDSKGEVVEGLSLIGNLAAGVPGTVRGMAELHRRFARLSWAEDLAPAIRLAHGGFVVDKNLVEHLQSDDVIGFDHLTNFDRYFGGVRIHHALRQPELAATLERFARDGPDEFYSGIDADLLVAQMQRGPVKGIITKGDLAAYRAVWRAPLTAEWRGL